MATTIPACFFNDCDHPVVDMASGKCDFHKNRGKCRAPDCHNQVYARRLCVRHGGKRQCQADGCGGNVRIGDFCARHGAVSPKKRCSEPNCTKVAHARQKCVRHGGGRKCKVPGCDTHARVGGRCCRHGGTPGAAKDAKMLGSDMLLPPGLIDTSICATTTDGGSLAPHSPTSVSGTCISSLACSNNLFSLSLHDDDWAIQAAGHDLLSVQDIPDEMQVSRAWTDDDVPFELDFDDVALDGVCFLALT